MRRQSIWREALHPFGRIKAISITTILTVIFAAAIVLAAQAGLREENKFLESELKLAKKPGIYVVFNLEESRVLIKAKGMTLKDIAVGDARLWGASGLPVSPLKLIKKSTLLTPKRTEIKPKKEEESEEEEEPGSDSSGTFELDALELKDMPSSYRLVLEGGVRILIRPKAEGFFGKVVDIFRTILWYVTKPVESAWNAMMRRPFAAIEIEIAKQDARHLYWSFPEGSEAIVYKPGE